MSQKIIKGYKGIMDLDLTNVDSKYHKELIEQHKKDIDQYMLDEEKLPLSKRYENTVGKAYQKLEYENYMRKLRQKN